MAVLTGKQAVDALRTHLGPPPSGKPYEKVPDGAPDSISPPPPAFTVAAPVDWLWDAVEAVPPLRDPTAYTSAPQGDVVGQAPIVLSTLSAADKDRYCRASADITMRGGTTSGVVYPLAVCEIARRFRLRSVGGASAGAIAAAMAAAAEVGRDRGLTQNPLDAELRKAGHVRAGFAGLADAMAWLAQVDEDVKAPDAFRLGRLFQPAPPAASLYKAAVAGMQRQWVRFPVLAVRAAGVAAAIFVVLEVLAAAFAIAAGSGLFAETSLAPAEWVSRMGAGVAWAFGCLLGITLGITLVGVGVVILVMGRHRKEKPPGPLGEPVLPTPKRDPVALTRAWIRGVVVVGLGIALTALTVRWGELDVVAVVAAATLLLVVVLATLGVGVWGLLRGAGTFGFGIIAGAADRTTAPGSRPVIDWLSDTLDELAGLTPVAGPGARPVLRFGHLWFGPEFDPAAAPSDEAVAAARDPRRRLVNLELVTSELVQSRAYRFPLPTSEVLEERDGSRLYFSVRDLQDADRHVVPKEVRDVLLAADNPRATRLDIRKGTKVELVELPEPWNLPVIVAVRLSMSLPGLFQAVRLYRTAGPGHVRDEFGRPLAKVAPEEVVPQDEGAAPAERRLPEYVDYPSGDAKWCEQLWFTDGGVTSNFPIHFFDAPLPLWPTFGINLGTHPPGFRSQDVWVPQDWDSKGAPTRALGTSMLGFFGSIVGTARGWRDTEQTFMPGTRGRVAWVRQRSAEGGANLFMTKETIASLALRGVVAGARMRRRLADKVYWQRSQWIRLRSAIDNLDELASDVGRSVDVGLYAELLGAGPAQAATRLTDLTHEKMLRDPRNATDVARRRPPRPVQWFEPVGDPALFWERAHTLVTGVARLDGADRRVVADGAPEPSPSLRQVPRV